MLEFIETMRAQWEGVHESYYEGEIKWALSVEGIRELERRDEDENRKDQVGQDGWREH